MWIVEQIPQLFRNRSRFFRGSTCQKRHSICSQGPSVLPVPGGRSRGEIGSLNPQQTSSCHLGEELLSVAPSVFLRTSRSTAQCLACAQQIVGTQSQFEELNSDLFSCSWGIMH